MIKDIYYGLFLIGIIINFSNSQTNFKYYDIDPAGPKYIWGKTVGDLNNDNLPDFIVCGHSRGGLVWYENPSWKKRIISPKKRFRTDVEVYDMDDDGDNDVIAIIKDSLLYFENGMQWKQHIISVGNVLHDIEIVDLDDDSVIEIVARDQDYPRHVGDVVFIFQKQGDASWEKIEIEVPDGEGLKVVDLNNDERPDILTNANWFENSGNINNWVRHQFTTSWTHTSAFVNSGDINADGRIDILHSPAEIKDQKYRMSWFEAPIDPNKEWVEHVIEDSIEAVRHFIGAADFDNDGKMDVITAEMTQGADPDEVLVYFNKDQGRNWERSTIGLAGSHSMRVLDVDNDGDIDLYGANWNGNVAQLWLNDFNPQFHLKGWERYVIDEDKGAKTLLIRSADLDGDGHKDIVSGGWWYRNPASFSLPWEKFPIGEDFKNIALIYDFDKDGLFDILGTRGKAKFVCELEKLIIIPIRNRP